VKPSLHYDANAKETFNRVLRKNTNSPTSYAQPLKDFAYFDFVES